MAPSSSDQMAEEFCKKLFENAEELAKNLAEEKNTEENLNWSDTAKEFLENTIKKLYLEEAIKHLAEMVNEQYELNNFLTR